MKTEFRGTTNRRAILSFMAVLAGGSALSTSCDSKIRIAVVSGLETTVLGLLDPSNFLGTGSTDTSVNGASLDP